METFPRNMHRAGSQEHLPPLPVPKRESWLGSGVPRTMLGMQA